MSASCFNLFSSSVTVVLVSEVTGNALTVRKFASAISDKRDVLGFIVTASTALTRIHHILGWHGATVRPV